MTPTTFLFLLLAFCALAGVAVFLMYQFTAAVREFLRFHGKMLVTCPETLDTAAVDVAALRAALAALVGRRHLALSNCSRWPERADCAQDCLCQVEARPESHRVWAVASQWFAGQTCAYCHQPIGRISHLDRFPAVLDANLKSIEWNKIPAEKLPEVFAKHPAVCWNCHIAETFRRDFADLVVDRPWRGDPRISRN